MTNRLILESSPYLLQHAHNPVDWYPWGEEAFAEARRLSRPILLSIGYSTCHWCHVMEHESFEDEEIAAYMNENYVAIKVDREERPDIDAVYMTAVQATTGRGGWPMTVWLTNDQKPFYAGTYFPPKAGARGAQFGFLELLKHLKRAFDEEPSTVLNQADEISVAVKEMLESSTQAVQVSADTLEKAVSLYQARFDRQFGGAKGHPKFPSSFPIRLLLRWHTTHPDPELLSMITTTLRNMARGGIYDQVGGGFHRYSTDSKWLVPHFEKMLYDNALLAQAYVEGFQATGVKEFSDVAHDIFQYIARDMTSPQGAFYSATDADSIVSNGELEEGFFYTWSKEELQIALTSDEYELTCRHYNVGDVGNFEGRHILYVDKDLAMPTPELTTKEEPVLPAQAGIQTTTLQLLPGIRQKLLKFRNQRPLPMRDEKILVSWNALMISALARASRTLVSSEYLARALHAANFIFDNMFRDNQLFRVYKNSKAHQSGFLDDYTFLCAASMDLYEATSDPIWLSRALELDRILHEQFEDETNGAFFMTSHTHETLMAREKPSYDGAEPSGNSVQCLNLQRLYQLTMQDSYRGRAERCVSALSGALEKNPMALSELLIALQHKQAQHLEIMIIAPDGRLKETQPFTDELRRHYLPNAVTVVLEESQAKAQQNLVPAMEGKVAIEGKVTVYVCEMGACQLPIFDVTHLKVALTF